MTSKHTPEPRCGVCGNQDCPTVSAEPTWNNCPATLSHGDTDMPRKHTPGPWTVQGKYKTEISGPKGTYIIADLGRPCDPEVWELLKADARLMAAAPTTLDLLRRLEVAVSLGSKAEADDLCFAVRAHIAEVDK